MTESLSDRLKALGFIPAASVKKTEPAANLFDFSKELNTKMISNQYGDVHVVINQYPMDYQHGVVNFRDTTEIESLSTVARVKTSEGTHLGKLLFLDTETTGLSGGTGTIAFLVGVGYFTTDGFLLKQYILKDPSQEPAMLLEILNLCQQFSGLVTFNGKGFDAPLLKSRFILNRFPIDDFQNLAHFDLLYLSRKVWKNRLPSRTLQDLEHEILEIPRTDDEVPGWMIPEIYFNYLHSNDPTPLKGVVYHNGMDILSLAALFLYLSSSVENIHESAQFNPIDYFSLGQLYYELGIVEIAEKIFVHCFEENKLPVDLKLKLLHNLSSINKSRSNFERSIYYCEIASQFEDIEAAVEIAKYYEHEIRDYSSAFFWTEKAISFLDKKGYHTYQNKKVGKELLKRKDRLLQRLERTGNNV